MSIDELIAATEKGDTAAAAMLINAAITELRSGEITPKLAAWLADSLHHISEGVEAKRALGLSIPEGGRPPKDDDKLNRDLRIFLHVMALRKYGDATTERVDDAAEAVGEFEGLAGGYCKDIYKKQLTTLKREGFPIDNAVEFVANAERYIRDMFRAIEAIPEKERITIAKRHIEHLRSKKEG